MIDIWRNRNNALPTLSRRVYIQRGTPVYRMVRSAGVNKDLGMLSAAVCDFGLHDGPAVCP